MMNSKFLFAILVAAMLLASGCVSIIKVPDGDVSEEDIATEIEEISEDLEELEGAEEEEEDLPTKKVVEGELISFPNLKAVDPDGDPITYTFSNPLDEDGEWKTKVGDAGRYTVTITASDGTSEVSQDVLIIVKALNNPPVLEELDDIEVDEGDTVELKASVSDPDDDDVEITFSGWMSSSKKNTDYDDAGTHTVTVTASDGKDSVSQTVVVTINNINRPPRIEDIDDIEVDEGEKVSVDVTASDPDGDDVEISFSDPLDEDGEWRTSEGDAGKYAVSVTATDGDLETEESFYVNIISINKAPVLEGVADIEVDESDKIELAITASDPEGEDVTITYSSPFSSSGVWQTDYDDSGEYVVTVTASDGERETEETFSVTVNNRNRPPSFGEGAFD